MVRVNRVPAKNGWAWVKQGIVLFGKEPMLWLAMALVYVLMAILLNVIPFIGWLILVLITPVCMLGGLTFAQARDGLGFPSDTMPPLSTFTSRPWLNYPRDLLTRATRRLCSGIKDKDRLLPIMVISTLLLGGVVVIKILAQLLKVGGASLPAIFAGSVGPSVWLTAVIGLLVVISLETLLIMLFVYTMPLILFRGEHPLPSIELSFSGALNSLGAFAIFVGIFATAGESVRILFLLLRFPFDYLAIIAVGLLLLPVFIAGLSASYRDLFTRPPATPHD
jgi:hypothetical protein